MTGQENTAPVRLEPPCTATPCTGRSAAFGLPEITLGIIHGSGGTQRLPRVAGPARAKELIRSGRTVAADEALAVGLADRVLDDAGLLRSFVDSGPRKPHSAAVDGPSPS
jgi:enoyl-CoA hydratase/carnithine racemase